jgi:hypothetical protein
MKTQSMALAALATLSLINAGLASAATGSTLRQLQEQAAVTRKDGDGRIFTATPVVKTAAEIQMGRLEQLQAQANDTRKNGGDSLFYQSKTETVLVASLATDSSIMEPSPAGESLQRLVWQGKVNRSGRN